MNRFVSSPFAVLLAWLLLLPSPAQEKPALPDAETPLPFDPAVRIGKLDNGIRYFIRENPKPENRLELRLAVGAGSVLEADDQQGLAHYLEHMAFNGTKNFEKQELVDFLESIGMSFGSHLNAYTSMDETVYQLQVPTENESDIRTAFQILTDWAHNLTLADEDIEEERGVIIEEWRGRRGASQRIMDQQLPILLKGSKYADRMPIGKKEVLDTFKFERIRDFYRDWYRPELMSIVVVGPKDPDEVETLIKEFFDKVPATKPEDKPPKKTPFEVPDHKETLTALITDPEASSNRGLILWKHPKSEVKTHGDFRRAMVEGLFFGMVNARLSELAQEADPPFLGASFFRQSFVPTKDMVGVGAMVKDGGFLRGLEATLVEVERVRLHGFTATEFERAKINRLRSVEQAYREREKARSRGFASSYVNAALKDQPTIGIEKSHELHNLFMPTIRLDELNKLGNKWLTQENRVITADGPDKEGNMPTEAEFLALFDTVANQHIEPYAEDVADTPLVKDLPPTAKITKRHVHEDVQVTRWTLDNGAVVLLKPTDFKADQILFRAFSKGGSSLMPTTNDFVSASYSASVVAMGGLGDFSMINLGKRLAGKVARVSPSISTLGEGFSGSCSPQDLPTLFELMLGYRDTPRKDAEVFESFQKRQIAMLKNRLLQPEAVFSDEVVRILSQDHPRARPVTPDTIRGIDLDAAHEFYKTRFANPGDFTYLFVGNFTLEDMEPLVTKYLGGGEKTERETFVDLGIRPPEGKIEKTVRKGLEPKSQVMLSWWGDFEWNYPARHALQSMVSVLNIKLRERIREELGGTYSISAYSSTDHYPAPEWSINIVFGCDPDQVDTLLEAVYEEINKLQAQPVDELTVTKVREQQIRSREVSMKENSFWAQVLSFYERNGEDFSNLFLLHNLARELEPKAIRKTAVKYFTSPNHGKFILLPEEVPEEEQEEEKEDATPKEDAAPQKKEEGEKKETPSEK